MFYYAQLNENNICIGVSQLSGEVINDSLIRIDNADSSLLGKKYNNGLWEDVPTPDPPEPTPTNQDVANATIISKINELTLLLKGVS